MIFHSSPKFKLEDFLFHQKKLLPLSRESQVRFVPNLVLITLERLETLIASKACTPVAVIQENILSLILFRLGCSIILQP